MATIKPNPANYPGRWARATRKNAHRSAAHLYGRCIPISDNAKYIRWYLAEAQRLNASNNPDEFQ